MLRGMLPQSLQIKTASAADDAQQALDQAAAAHTAMGALSSPAAVPIPPKPTQATAPAYKPAEQKDLDRLIDNTR